ncbi:MAG TPA: glycosyltransferase family 39 protein [Candidatus Paceibacterota bacterium]|nr:glycosyltransferase family 39 protein [Candidatus Paceibacterota bacterium]
MALTTIQKVLLLGLTGAAVFFATYHLTESPPFTFDEGWYFQTAANLVTANVEGIQLAPGDIEHVSTFVTVGYPLIYPLALWFKLFGISVLSARSLMVLFILLFLITSYVLARKLCGVATALAALALLATFPPLYGNGKPVLGEVPGLLYLVLSLLCLYQARTHTLHKTFWIILTGISVGLCIVTKPLFLIMAPALLAGVYGEWKKNIFTLRDIGIGFLSTLAPIAAWVVVQFRSSDSFSTVLSYYANPYNTQLSTTILHNLGGLFSDVNTLYTVGIAFVWAAALWVRRTAQEDIPSEERIAFVFAMLVILAYLRTGGFYRYLFPAQAVMLIFFPHALMRISMFAHSFFPRLQSRLVAMSFITLLGMLGSYQVLFHSWVAEAYTSQKTAFWESYLSEVSTTTSIFFYNAPEVAAFAPHRNYYQYIENFGRSIGADQRTAITAGTVDRIIIQTGWYIPTDPLFKKYTTDRTAYKYSVLRLR